MSARVEPVTREEIEKRIAPIAAKFEVKPEYWISGYDEGFSFCCDCAKKKIQELEKEKPSEEYFLSGGYSIEGDSQAFCDTCGEPLDNSYSTFACEQELDYFEENGFNPRCPSDCHSLSEILMAGLYEDSELSLRIQTLAISARYLSLPKSKLFYNALQVASRLKGEAVAVDEMLVIAQTVKSIKGKTK